MNSPQITTTGFLSEFMRRHVQMPDRPFCWILGSGASIQSGIKTGGAMAHEWLREIDVCGGCGKYRNYLI